MDIEKKVAEARLKHGKPFVTETPVARLRKPSRDLRRLNRLSAQAAAPVKPAAATVAVKPGLRRIAGGRS